MTSPVAGQRPAADVAPPEALPTASEARGPRFPGWRPFLYQFLAYALVGASNVAVTLGVLNFIIYARGITGGPQLLVADAIAVGAAIANSYVWNSLFTFRSGALFQRAVFVRFLVVNFIGLLVNQAIFAAIVYPLLNAGVTAHAASTLAQVGALSVQFVSNFVGLRYWAYRGAAERQPEVERPLLAPPTWRPPVQVDVELASIAAGERQAAWFWRMRATLLAYFGLFALFAGFGWYSSVVVGMSNGDGTARIAQAYGVFFSRDPHLGALGLIWPPLPAVVDMPILLLLRPFGYAYAAGSIMGALFAAGAVVVLFKVLRELGAGPALASVLAITFLANPQVYQSAAAGLSEPSFALFLLTSLWCYLRWLRTQSVGALSFAGLFAAFAALSRYEAFFWVAGMAVAVVLHVNGGIPFLPRLMRKRGTSAAHAATTATLISFITPCVFVTAMWMLANLQLKGDPLYFLTGEGSTKSTPDVAITVGPAHVLWYAYRSASGSLSLALDRVSVLSPLMLFSTAFMSLYVLLRRKPDAAGLLMVAWSISAFHVLSAYQGTLPPWTRYWFWVVPMGFVLSVYLLSRISQPTLRKIFVAWIVLAAMAPAIALFVHPYNTREDVARSQGGQREVFLTNPDLDTVAARRAAQQEYGDVAHAVDAHVPRNALVMLDVSGFAGAIPMFSARPRQFVTPNDRDFDEEFMPRPWDSVQYVLVPEPGFDVMARSVLLRAYPKLWDGLPWEKLVTEIPGPSHWRLYEVIPKGALATPPTAGS